MKIFLLTTLLLTFVYVQAQNVGIGTNAPLDFAKLDISSTTSGFQMPRLTSAQRATLASNIAGLSAALSVQYAGLMVYDVTNNTLYMWDATKSTNGDWANVLDEDASVADADADATNELQNLSNVVSGTDRTINISGGTGTTISVADNDNDSSNEHNTNLTLTGTTLNVIDGGGTQSQDLSSLENDNWYEVGQTRGADDINDNIFTQGDVGIGVTSANSRLHVNGATGGNALRVQVNGSSKLTVASNGGTSIGAFQDTPPANGLFVSGDVGIGTNLPDESLSVRPNTDNSAEIGRVHIGAMGHTDWAGFSHIDINSTGGYALLQNTSGRTLLNSASGQVIGFRNNNTDQFQMEADGDLSMLNGNSIKMPNNIRWAENRGVTGYGNDDNYKSGTFTGTMNVEPGNVIKIDATALLRLTGGSGNDDFYIRVNVDGASGCADLNTEESGWIRHNEGGGDHDNFRTYSYMDVINVTCTGTMRFRLQVKNTGDDSWQRMDAIVVGTKF